MWNPIQRIFRVVGNEKGYLRPPVKHTSINKAITKPNDFEVLQEKEETNRESKGDNN